MHVPNPDNTLFGTAILSKETDAGSLKYTLENLTKDVLEKWEPGQDIVLVLRQLTAEEEAGVLAAQE